jgi:1-acyl-sn-glycerol-3-phosphate acyltransferase
MKMDKLGRGMWAVGRILFLIPVLSIGLLLAVTIMRTVSYAFQRKIIIAWSKLLLAVLGIQVITTNKSISESNGLVVANHVSWIDAFVLGSVFGVKFVVRSDVADWPILGRLVTATGALFVDRASPRAMQRSCNELMERLRSGQQFAVFPEGTTSNGRELLAFRANFFEAPLKTLLPVTVVALKYIDINGVQNLSPNYDGDISFQESFLRILMTKRKIIANTTIVEVLQGFDCRKKLASTAEMSIRNIILETKPI